MKDTNIPLNCVYVRYILITVYWDSRHNKQRKKKQQTLSLRKYQWPVRYAEHLFKKQSVIVFAVLQNT